LEEICLQAGFPKGMVKCILSTSLLPKHGLIALNLPNCNG